MTDWPGKLWTMGFGSTPAAVTADNPVPTEDPRIRHAINEVYSTYSQTVSVLEKKKSLLKFGRNDALGSSNYALVWMNTTQATETLLTSNAIDSVSSSDNGDTQSVVIEGHTISGSDLTFVTQTVTLTGQTRKALTTALARANRVYNNGATDFAGNVWVYENTALTSGVPTDKTKAHITATGTKNQSEKAATSISSVDYWFITSCYGSVLTKTTANVEFDLQVRLSGKVFRTRHEFAASNASGLTYFNFDPFIIVPPNSDVRIMAKASTTNVEVQAGINGYLAIVT